MVEPNAVRTRLCQSCDKLTLQALYKGTTYYSLNSSCDLCDLVRDGIRSRLPDREEPALVRLSIDSEDREDLNGFNPLGLFHEASYYLKRQLVKHLPSVRDFVKIREYPFSLLTVEAPGGRRTCLKVTPLDDSRPALASYLSGRQVKPAACQENIDMIQSWISTCVDGHSVCRKLITGRVIDDRIKKTPLPTRLVQVTPVPRLRATAGQLGQYVALSYCWGANINPNSVTTRTTLQQFEEKIPLGLLAPTVRDAVVLVQKLGFQYLWVDSLCIVQDDEAEWMRESRQMGQVFEGAMCTIAALGANCADEGLFLSGNDAPIQREDLSSAKEVILPCIATKGEVIGHASLSVWPRFQSDSHRVVFADFYESRWMKRGWVLQERILSRRMVYFGRNQIHWTCKEKRLHEDGIHYNIANRAYTNNYNLSLPLELINGVMHGIISPLRHVPILRRSRELQDFDKTIGLEKIWHFILKDYSRCSLTRVGDKLMAIAGLASSFTTLTGSTYFWGIWIESVSFCLAWRPQGSLALGRAPSWSWASWDGPLTFWSDSICFRDAVPSSKAAIATSANGLEILEITADVVRFARLEMVDESSHLSEDDFKENRLFGYHGTKSPHECPSCQDGWCRHFYAWNSADQICGLIELDQGETTTLSDFEGIVLLVEGLYCVLIIQQESGDPGRFRRLGTGVIRSYDDAFFSEGRPDGIIRQQRFQLI